MVVQVGGSGGGCCGKGGSPGADFVAVPLLAVAASSAAAAAAFCYSSSLIMRVLFGLCFCRYCTASSFYRIPGTFLYVLRKMRACGRLFLPGVSSGWPGCFVNPVAPTCAPSMREPFLLVVVPYDQVYYIMDS